MNRNLSTHCPCDSCMEMVARAKGVIIMYLAFHSVFLPAGPFQFSSALWVFFHIIPSCLYWIICFFPALSPQMFISCCFGALWHLGQICLVQISISFCETLSLACVIEILESEQFARLVKFKIVFPLLNDGVEFSFALQMLVHSLNLTFLGIWSNNCHLAAAVRNNLL